MLKDFHRIESASLNRDYRKDFVQRRTVERAINDVKLVGTVLV